MSESTKTAESVEKSTESVEKTAKSVEEIKIRTVSCGDHIERKLIKEEYNKEATTYTYHKTIYWNLKDITEKFKDGVLIETLNVYVYTKIEKILSIETSYRDGHTEYCEISLG